MARSKKRDFITAPQSADDLPPLSDDPIFPESQIRLLDDRVAILIDKAPDRSAGGIYLPAAAQEEQSQGVVWCVGPGKLEKGERVPCQVSPNDKVIFGRFAGVDVELNGKTLRIVRECDVMAVYT